MGVVSGSAYVAYLRKRDGALGVSSCLLEVWQPNTTGMQLCSTEFKFWDLRVVRGHPFNRASLSACLNGELGIDGGGAVLG